MPLSTEDFGMRSRAQEPGGAVFFDPYSEPVAGVADMTFDRAVPVTALQPVCAVATPQRLLCCVGILGDKPNDLLQVRKIGMPTLRFSRLMSRWNALVYSICSPVRFPAIRTFHRRS